MSHNRRRNPSIEVRTDASPTDRIIESAEAIALVDIAKTVRKINANFEALIKLLSPILVRKATSVALSVEPEPA